MVGGVLDLHLRLLPTTKMEKEKVQLAVVDQSHPLICCVRLAPLDDLNRKMRVVAVDIVDDLYHYHGGPPMQRQLVMKRKVPNYSGR
jgi:hypothetical protein